MYNSQCLFLENEKFCHAFMAKLLVRGDLLHLGIILWTQVLCCAAAVTSGTDLTTTWPGMAKGLQTFVFWEDNYPSELVYLVRLYMIFFKENYLLFMQGSNSLLGCITRKQKEKGKKLLEDFPIPNPKRSPGLTLKVRLIRYRKQAKLDV